MVHIPAFLETILYYFSPHSGDYFIDCTAGEGGHTIPIAHKVAPQGKVLAIDRDAQVLEVLRENIKQEGLENMVRVKRGNFKNLIKIVRDNNFPPARGILFDLGFSSWHIEHSGRGFSFQKNEFLDMRYNPDDKETLTAAQILNGAHRRELERILREYGEEYRAERIVRAIVHERKKNKIETTGDLVNIIAKVIPRRGKINPATKTFQALRIAVNNELENVKEGLDGALEVLKNNGQIVVITFHSLEDRLVKNTFKNWASEGKGDNLTKKVIKPTWEEVQKNPRARSAKLRIFKVH